MGWVAKLGGGSSKRGVLCWGKEKGGKVGLGGQRVRGDWSKQQEGKK